MAMRSDLQLQSWLTRNGFPVDGYEIRIANGTTPLMKASHLGETEIVRLLLERGVDLNARNRDGNNALWLACVNGNLDAIELLIAAGIDIDNRNDNQATCTMYAASTGKSAALEKLIASGANLTFETLDGFSALDMAATLVCLNLLRRAARHASISGAAA